MSGFSKPLRAILSVIVLVLTAPSCSKKDPVYILEGQVKSYTTGQGLSGVSVSVEQRTVGGNVFSGAFTQAASGSTAPDGKYQLEWPRTQLAEVRLLASKASYIPAIIALDPEDFLPEEVVYQSVRMRPEAFVEVTLTNTGESATEDLMRFRFTQVNFDCACCNGDWKEISGADADTTFSCRIHGDIWLKYWAEVTAESGNLLIIDSLWCPSFVTTPLVIEY
jgi:hypothetical protein